MKDPAAEAAATLDAVERGMRRVDEPPPTYQLVPHPFDEPRPAVVVVVDDAPPATEPDPAAVERAAARDAADRETLEAYAAVGATLGAPDALAKFLRERDFERWEQVQDAIEQARTGAAAPECLNGAVERLAEQMRAGESLRFDPPPPSYIVPPPPAPTCATCQYWDPSEPPRRDAKDPRRRCGALSTGQDLGRAQSPLPVLIVPLTVSGPQTVAVYTAPAFTCSLHQRRAS